MGLWSNIKLLFSMWNQFGNKGFGEFIRNSSELAKQMKGAPGGSLENKLNEKLLDAEKKISETAFQMHDTFTQYKEQDDAHNKFIENQYLTQKKMLILSMDELESNQIEKKKEIEIVLNDIDKALYEMSPQRYPIYTHEKTQKEPTPRVKKLKEEQQHNKKTKTI